MKGHDVIVVGASAGGIEALRKLLGTLPANLPAAIVVVVHMPMQPDDLLPAILRNASIMPVQTARHRCEFGAGNVYVAAPGSHLLINGSKLSVDRGPRENRHRPAIDPLFRSAARCFGERVIGVLLSGHLDDGMMGLNAIKTHGGIAMVQSPDETSAADTVQAALRNVQVDFTLPVVEIGKRLIALSSAPLDLAPSVGKPPANEPPRGV